MFGDENGMEKASCLNLPCFKKNVDAHLKENWESKYKEKYGTNGFRYYDYSDYENRVRYHEFNDKGMTWGKDPGEKCPDCKDYVTLFTPLGKLEKKHVCVGPEKCYNSIRKPQQGKKTDGPPKHDGPRVSWHGEHFREEFYQEVLPSWIENLKPDEEKTQRLALSAILNSNHEALDVFRRKYQGKDRIGYAPFDNTWAKIESMASNELAMALRDMALVVTMQKDKTDHYVRGLMAAHLGLDLSREWSINKEYLDKKTTAEILELGEKLGIFTDPKVMSFLTETLGKKKFKGLKKSELVSVFLDSGVNLVGKVPEEVLNLESSRKQTRSCDLDDDDDGQPWMDCNEQSEESNLCSILASCGQEVAGCCYECDDQVGCEKRCKKYDTQEAQCQVSGDPCTHRQGMDCEHTVACCNACEIKCPSRCGISLTDGTVDNAEASSIEGQV
jgi:hypothetical protein